MPHVEDNNSPEQIKRIVSDLSKRLADLAKKNKGIEKGEELFSSPVISPEEKREFDLAIKRLKEERNRVCAEATTSVKEARRLRGALTQDVERTQEKMLAQRGIVAIYKHLDDSEDTTERESEIARLKGILQNKQQVLSELIGMIEQWDMNEKKYMPIPPFNTGITLGQQTRIPNKVTKDSADDPNPIPF